MSHPPLLNLPPFESTPQKKARNGRPVLIPVAIIVALGTVTLLGMVYSWYRLNASVEAAASKVSLAEPRTLGGRPLLTDPQFTQVTAQLEKQFARQSDVTNSFAAFYGEAGVDTVVVLAIERPVSSPKAMLFGSFRGYASEGISLEDMTEVDPGPLKGTAQCGITDDGVGSVGILVWYFATPDEALAEFTTLRAEIETKNG